MVSDRNNSHFGFLKCTLCRSSILNPFQAYQNKAKTLIACSICVSKFSKEDIELMAGLFLAYGGYFGKLSKNKKALQDFIDEMLEIFNKKGGKIKFEELNLIMVHRALLYGFTPQEYIKALESFLAKC